MNLVDTSNSKAITLRLERTVEVSQIENKELQAEIVGFYTRGKTKAIILIGTIINSCITENKPAFMLSRTLLYGLIKQDVNLKDMALYPRDYKELLMHMLNGSDALFECLNKPSMKKKGMSHNIAGLYRLRNAKLRECFSDIDIQESRIIKEYCEYQGIGLIVTSIA